VEGHSEISNKHELFKNVKDHMDSQQENAFFMLPLTFCLKVTQDKLQSVLRQQIKPFKQAFKLLEEFGTLFEDNPGNEGRPSGAKEEAFKAQTDGPGKLP
jgi:hypothetical protein